MFFFSDKGDWLEWDLDKEVCCGHWWKDEWHVQISQQWQARMGFGSEGLGSLSYENEVWGEDRL
jgi:hypothetical protein